MHRALLISAILHHVCQLLSDKRRTLACLARTARALHEPALNVLWWSLRDDQFINLLRCMPLGLWMCKSNGPWSRTIYLKRPIIPTDWDRILFYARRVRQLINPTAELSPKTRRQFVDAFRKHHPGVVLFPNLRDIDYRELESFELPLTFLLTLMPKSQLRSMGLWIGPERQSSIFKSIMDSGAPFLEDLAIYFDDAEEAHIACPTTFVDTLQALPRLKSLRLSVPWTWYPNAAVKHLPRLPSLETLSITSPGPLIVGTPSAFEWFSSAFPSIRHLDITVGYLGWFSALVRYLNHSRLKVHSLRLYSLTEISATGFQISLDAISRSFDPMALRELHIGREDGLGLSDDEHEPIDNDFFECLFVFVNLEM